VNTRLFKLFHDADVCKASLEKAKSWIRELQRQADPSIVIALCGNKLDLESRRQVTQEEAQRYAAEEGLMWGETSAKTGDGVNEIFNNIGESVITYTLTISLMPPKPRSFLK
jgi:GTPase SAR1 family protein